MLMGKMKIVLSFISMMICTQCVFANPENVNIVVGGDNGTILTSSDGTAWTKQSVNVNGTVSALVRRYDAYFGASKATSNQNSSSLVSTDGVHWNIYTPDEENFVPTNQILWADHQFFGVLTPDKDWGVVFLSLDGILWNPDFLIRCPLSSVAWGNNRYIIVGGTLSEHNSEGIAIITVDGSHWTHTTQFLPYMKKIIWHKNQFYAIGTKTGYLDPYQEEIITTTGGETWTWHDVLGKKQKLNDLTYGNNMFVAVGSDDNLNNYPGIIFTSSDGIHWKQIYLSNIPSLTAVAWVDNEFVAVGTQGTILTSSDGVKWRQQNSGTKNNLMSIA